MPSLAPDAARPQLPERRLMTHPTISVIIPNLNSPVIDQTLAALRRQIPAPAGTGYEVLVVGMDEPGLVQEDERVRFIRTPQPTPPAGARNLGIQAAQGDLLCFTDADCIPAPDWLARLTAPFADPGVAVAGGSVAFTADDYWTLCDNVSWFYELLPTSRPGIRLLLPSLNLCVRRQVVARVGLFNESYPRPAGEDAEWTTRMRQAGYDLHFVPAAVVLHQPGRADWRALLRHAHTYGRYSVKIRPDMVDFLATPIYLRHGWLTLLLAPPICLYATLRMYLRQPAMRRYWPAAPGVFLSKVAWCVGLAQTALHQRRSGV